MSAELTMGAFLKTFGAYLFAGVTSLVTFVTMKVKQERVIKDVEEDKQDLKNLIEKLHNQREVDRDREIDAERVRNQKMDKMTELPHTTLIEFKGGGK